MSHDVPFFFFHQRIKIQFLSSDLLKARPVWPLDVPSPKLSLNFHMEHLAQDQLRDLPHTVLSRWATVAQFHAHMPWHRLHQKESERPYCASDGWWTLRNRCWCLAWNYLSRCDFGQFHWCILWCIVWSLSAVLGQRGATEV